MADYPYSYISAKLETRSTARGFGSFATEPISAGELLVIWAGFVMPEDAFMQLDEHTRSISIQIEEGVYLAAIQPERADYINHSCTPNSGLHGANNLVAMRDIAVGEEVTFDYAMSDSTPYDQFDCACGTLNCRQKVTGNDWKIPELWARYAGYFSPYLQKKINAFREMQAD